MSRLATATMLEIQCKRLDRAMDRTAAALAALQAKGRAQSAEMVRLCDRLAAEREVTATARRMGERSWRRAVARAFPDGSPVAPAPRQKRRVKKGGRP